MQADKACGEKVKGAKQLFSKKEDEKLIKLVKFFGRKKDVNWQFVAQHLRQKLIRRNATLDNVLTIDVNTTNTRKSSPLVDYHSLDSSSSDTHDLSNDFQINDVENKHLVDEVFNTLFDTLEFNDDAFFGLTTI